MKSVYVVMEDTKNSTSVVHVFTDEDKAMAMVDELNSSQLEGSDYSYNYQNVLID